MVLTPHTVITVALKTVNHNKEITIWQNVQLRVVSVGLLLVSRFMKVIPPAKPNRFVIRALYTLIVRRKQPQYIDGCIGKRRSPNGTPSPYAGDANCKVNQRHSIGRVTKVVLSDAEIGRKRHLPVSRILNFRSVYSNGVEKMYLFFM